jgi:integrase
MTDNIIVYYENGGPAAPPYNTSDDTSKHLTQKEIDALKKLARQKFQDYLLCLFYSHYVLRNDLSDVKVVGKRAYRQLSDENKSETNYLVKHDTNKYFLVLNEYKTSKKYGEKQIELDTQVLKPLRKWLRQNDTGYLFLNSAGKPLTSNGISKTFGRIGKEFRGKPFGSSLLRHSYLSHKYGTTLENV